MSSQNWRKVFHNMTRKQENAIVLKVTRKLMKFTKKQLADLTGISQRHISKMESGKLVITEDNAKKMAVAMNTDYRLFL